MIENQSSFNGAVLGTALFLLALPTANTAHAAIVSSNLPGAETVGYPSDAYLSNGQYGFGGFPGLMTHTFAVKFSLAAPTRLTQLTFWGFEASPGFGNVSGFQAAIWNSSLTSTVGAQSWSTQRLATEGTGDGFTQQYAGLFDGSGIELAAGDYWLNIGAIATDPSQSVDWGWSWGTDQQEMAIAQASGTRASQWSQWYPFDLYKAGGAHILFGQVIPAPGIFGALALFAPLGGGRRSRRRAR